MSRNRDLQKALHQYRFETGVKDVDMRDVARFAVERLGMALPKPKDPLDRLAGDLAKAAREETRYDNETGRPYRANHMYIDSKGQRLWLDIDDEAPRGKMLKSLTLRREQVIGDAYHMEVDADHWNAAHPQEEPIQMVLDFTADVAERKTVDGADDEDDEAA